MFNYFTYKHLNIKNKGLFLKSVNYPHVNCFMIMNTKLKSRVDVFEPSSASCWSQCA